jgi:hypothetical protein
MIGPGERGNTLTVSCFDPSMDIGRAKKIVGAMLENAFYNMGLRDGEDKPTDIAAYTLAEMVQANQMVSDDSGETDPETGGTKRMMNCDDRLVAEAEFDPSVAIPGEPMDEYQAIITAKDAWLACEDLADICRERDKEIVRLKSELDQAMRVVRLVDSIFILVGKLNVSTVSVIGAAS